MSRLISKNRVNLIKDKLIGTAGIIGCLVGIGCLIYLPIKEFYAYHKHAQETQQYVSALFDRAKQNYDSNSNGLMDSDEIVRMGRDFGYPKDYIFSTNSLVIGASPYFVNSYGTLDKRKEKVRMTISCPGSQLNLNTPIELMSPIFCCSHVASILQLEEMANRQGKIEQDRDRLVP